MLSSVAQRLSGQISGRIADARVRLVALSGAEALRSPRYYLEERRMTLSHLEQRAEAALQSKIAVSKQNFGALCAKLHALSPLEVLSRGYTAVFDKSGAPITQGGALTAGQEISIRFFDTTVDAAVLGVQKGE